MRVFFTLMVATMLAGQAWAKDFTVDNNAAADTAKQTDSDIKMDTAFWRYRFKRYKGEYIYDANENITLKIVYNWNHKTNMWVNNMREEYAYNVNRQKNLYALYGWNATTKLWRGWHKDEFAYDANGRQILYAYSQWNIKANSWANYYKKEYTYNADGNETSCAFYFWDAETNSWANLYKYEYTYNADGWLQEEVKYFWNAETKQLEKSDKRKNVVRYKDLKLVKKTMLFAEVESIKHVSK